MYVGSLKRGIKCADCGKETTNGAIIAGKVYCSNCGRNHIGEAVQIGLAQAKRKYGEVN